MKTIVRQFMAVALVALGISLSSTVLGSSMLETEKSAVDWLTEYVTAYMDRDEGHVVGSWHEAVIAHYGGYNQAIDQLRARYKEEDRMAARPTKVRLERPVAFGSKGQVLLAIPAEYVWRGYPSDMVLRTIFFVAPSKQSDVNQAWSVVDANSCEVRAALSRIMPATTELSLNQMVSGEMEPIAEVRRSESAEK
jgi:hypothetical protein